MKRKVYKIVGIAFFILVISGCNRLMEEPEEKRKTGYEKTRILHHELLVEIQPYEQQVNIADHIKMEINLKEPVETYLDEDFEIGSIQINEKELQYTRQEDKIEIPTGQITEGDTILLVQYHGRFPVEQHNAWVQKLVQEKSAHFLLESMWYPLPIDIDDVELSNVNIEKVTGSITFKLPKDWTSITNGVKTKEELTGQYKMEQWDIDEKVLGFSFAAAPYHVYKEGYDGSKELQFYSLEEFDEEDIEEYVVLTKDVLQFYQRFIGYPYPFFKFAVVQLDRSFSGGHGDASFISMGEKNFHSMLLPWLYAHETVHQWFPHTLHGKDEAAFWLTEGLANYLALKAIEAFEGELARDYLLDYYKNTYLAVIAGTQDKPILQIKPTDPDPERAIVYNKGALVFYAIEQKIGEENMKKVLYESIRRYKDTGISLEEFQNIIEEVSEQDMDELLDLWLNQVGAF